MNKRLLRIALTLFLGAGILLSLWLFRDQLSVENLAALVDEAGILAPILFMGIYAMATIFFLPGSIMTLAGGFIFGPVWGTVFNLSGAVVGATIAFWFARFIGADWIKAKTRKRLTWLLEGIEQSGWRFVAVVRLIPAIPFNLLNYALGLTPIKTVPYVLASAFFMLPGCFAYTYLGHLGEAVLAQEEGVVQKVLWGIALLVVVSLIPWALKRFKAFKKLDLDKKQNS